MDQQIRKIILKIILIVGVVFNFEILSKILMLIEIIAIPLGVYAVYQTSVSLALQVDANEQQTIATAWQQLTTPALGNSGKAEAIMALSQRGVELTNLQLDCETMGGRYEPDPLIEDHRRCKSAPYLANLSLKGDFRETKLNRIVLDGAHLYSNQFDNVTIVGLSAKDSVVDYFNVIASNAYDVEFTGSLVRNVSFVDVETTGLIAIDARFYDGEFAGGYVDGADFTNTRFSGVSINVGSIANWNVSGVEFCWKPDDPGYPESPPDGGYCVSGLRQEDFNGMWAWEDNPPKGEGVIAPLLSSVRLCKVSLKADYYKSIRKKPFNWVLDRGYTVPDGC